MHDLRMCQTRITAQICQCACEKNTGYYTPVYHDNYHNNLCKLVVLAVLRTAGGRFAPSVHGVVAWTTFIAFE